MTKKILLTVSCLLFLLSILCFSNAMVQAEPNQAESLYTSANQYEEARQFDKATSLYGQVLAQFPEDAYGSRARLDIAKTAIISLIESGNFSQAQTELDRFTADFKTHWYFPPALYRIAERFEEARWPDKAKTIYAQIVQQYPTDTYAERAKIDVIKTTIISDMESGNDSQAQMNFNQLNADFKSKSYLPAALYRIAERYEESRKFDKAKTVYTQIVQQYPSSEFAVRSQIDIAKVEAICLIDSGKDAEIQAIISKIKSDFNGNSYLPAALYRICERFEDAKKYDTAKAIYGQISQEFPNSSFASRAQLNIAKINVIVSVVPGSDIATQSAVDKLAADYDSATYPMISNAIYLITEKCYAEGIKSDVNSDVNQVADDKLVALSAALLDKYVLGKICGRDNKASAYYISGLNYDRLGDYAKAAQAFQGAYDANPKHQYADYCLFAQGYCCEKLLEQKLVSKTAATATITSQYSQLISKYPQSAYAPHARFWLENNSK